MVIPTEKKQGYVLGVVGHLLARGLSDCGIRSLGRAAGLSDRMLIYHFGTKDALLALALNTLAEGLAAQLSALLGDHRRPAATLLGELLAASSAPALAPSLRLWFEIVGAAAAGTEPYVANARVLAQNWLAWLEARIDPADPIRSDEVFARLEGRLLMRMVGVEAAGDA